jgi:hypothetical protein
VFNRPGDNLNPEVHRLQLRWPSSLRSPEGENYMLACLSQFDEECQAGGVSVMGRGRRPFCSGLLDPSGSGRGFGSSEEAAECCWVVR